MPEAEFIGVGDGRPASHDAGHFHQLAVQTAGNHLFKRDFLRFGNRSRSQSAQFFYENNGRKFAGVRDTIHFQQISTVHSRERVGWAQQVNSGSVIDDDHRAIPAASTRAGPST